VPGSTTSAWGSRPEISFGPAFRLKISIDKLCRRSPCCRALRSAKPRPLLSPGDELAAFSFDHFIGNRQQGQGQRPPNALT
jgi:hypothetical protein